MKQKLKTKGFIIKETGEFIDAGNIIELKEKVDIEESFRYKSTNEVVKMLGNFNWLYFGKLIQLEIQDQYKFRLLYLSSYMDYDNRLLHDNNTIVSTDKHFTDLFKLSDKETKRTLKLFLDNNLMYKKDKSYYLDKKIFSKGKIKALKGDKDIVKLFEQGIKDLYKEVTPREHKFMMNIFYVLPYVNINHNLLCIREDTLKYDLKDIQPLELNDIMKLTNCKVKKVAIDKLKNTIVKNNFVFMRIGVGSSEFYYVNPMVYYKNSCKDIKHLNFLVEHFDKAKIIA